MKRFPVLLLLCSAAFAQVADSANEGYKTQDGRDAVARTLANPHRDQTQHPRELVEAMGLRERMKVADVGTGIGYMLPYLSHAVGPAGVVYAEDIAPDFIEKARLRAFGDGIDQYQVSARYGSGPKLPGACWTQCLCSIPTITSITLMRCCETS